MQSVSSRIWTRVTMSISYNDNHYTTGTLSGATITGQNGLGSDSNEEALHISQSSSITGTSPSDCLMSNPGHLLGGVGSYLSGEMQSVYSTAPSWLGFYVLVHRVRYISCICMYGCELIISVGIYIYIYTYDIYHCLPPDRTWHKVKSPKAD